MTLRKISLYLLFVLLLMAGSVVGAQEEIDLCFGLNADDCAAINAASLGAPVVDSLNVNLDINFSAANIPVGEGTVGSVDFTTNAVVGIVGFNEDLPNIGGSVVLNGATENLDALLGMPGLGEIGLEFRLVDGLFYFQNPTSGEWAYVDLMAVMSDPTFAEGMGSVTELASPDALTDALGSDGEMPDIAALGDAVTAIVSLPGFLSYTRDGDVFTFTVDLTALAALDNETLFELSDLVSAVDETAGGLVFVLPSIFDEGTITVTQTIDPSGEFLQALGFNVAAVTSALDPTSDPATVDLDVSLSLTDFDAVAAAVAPEGATEIPPEQISAIFEGALSQLP